VKVTVIAKPNAKVEKVEPMPDGSFNVFVKAPARDGLANEAIITALAKHFATTKKQVRLCVGGKGKHKIFEIDV
jgi:uncharacterized protein YggU (UPF0235/DUF167 family)